MNEQVKKVMADILELDPGAIGESTSRDNTATWDSLGHVNLVLALEQEFDLTFDVSEIEAMISYGDIVRVLGQKL